MNNGEVHVGSTIVRNVMSSVDKSEIVALYLNAKDDVVVLNTLKEMGHLHPEAPLQTENSIAEVIVNRTIGHRRSKSMDIRF